MLSYQFYHISPLCHLFIHHYLCFVIEQKKEKHLKVLKNFSSIKVYIYLFEWK